jgi:Raf kinase inhibitor-like YbhB/YbcL family protein
MSLESSLGRLLRPVRAGDRHLLQNDPRLDARSSFDLSSPDFSDGGMMPRQCAGAGVGDIVSPAIRWTGVPPAAVELGLVIQDPDAPLPRLVTHLIAFGIDPGVGGAAEGAFEAGDGSEFHFGRGSFGRIGYQGPRPVAGHGPHRYFFQVFALGKPLRFDAPPDLAALAAAMAGSVLARARLTGRYERP